MLHATDPLPSNPSRALERSAHGEAPNEPRLVIEPGPPEACRIDHVSQMAPFLMSLVSASDHWLFMSSAGGLTAGRRGPERALFPYETDDRLHHAYGVSGQVTLLRVHRPGEDAILWEPFDDRGLASGRRRCIRKCALGSWIELEETDDSLGLCMRVRWSTSERFGFVRSSDLTRLPGCQVHAVDVLDGLLDILPDGVPLGLQQKASCLVDAYKRSELDADTGLGIYSLEAQISDHPAPSESLFANVVWHCGAAGAKVLLSERSVRAFRAGKPLEGGLLNTGERGAYLLQTRIDVRGTPHATWKLVADVHLGQVEVEALRARLRSSPDLTLQVERDVEEGQASLRRLVALADGFTRTGDPTADVHHSANVLFNEMRGGVFEDVHHVRSAELKAFIVHRNRRVFARHAPWLAVLGEPSYRELLAAAEGTGDPQLLRLCYEFLPLTFSRTHGDPSRPWNQFSIRPRGSDGRRILGYEGNWRDIFQNWEALCQSFPAFLDGVIAKFVNASTVDGFNPYRVTSEGIAWETPDPSDPWGNIGYWGDHQIPYLGRLLEASVRMRPGRLQALLTRDLFSYADVPYRIRPYAELIRDAKDTIVFDDAAARRVAEQSEQLGSDGRLVKDERGEVHLVNLAEKLLVAALAKLSNLVVDGGIWLNTQRPEWNDANNALVGSGLSVVALGYLRRYLSTLDRLWGAHAEYALSERVADWLAQVLGVLREQRACLAAPRVDARTARRILDVLGVAFSDYRERAYAGQGTGRVAVRADVLKELCQVALSYVDHGIGANRRPDGLYHAYNLVRFSADEAVVEHLYEMLEGQVAALSAGLLNAREALSLVDALFASALYRADQDTFMLYPARRLPSFLEKNRVAPESIASNPLLLSLLAAGEGSIVVRDVAGQVRFHPTLTGAPALSAALRRVRENEAFSALVDAHSEATLETFEVVFQHHAFTGRSGTMHKYEGIGCVYWHMVAKLLVAAQEALFDAVRGGATEAVVAGLAAAYYRVQGGLLYRKTPLQSGAFSTDPYSHTPLHMGAQQPGMTGLVKEEILTRFGELGLRVEEGLIGFAPTLLRQRDLLHAPSALRGYDASGSLEVLEVPAGALAFSYCRVPFLLRASGDGWKTRVYWRDGGCEEGPGQRLTAAASAAVLEGTGEVERVEVEVPTACFVDEERTVRGGRGLLRGEEK